MADRRHDFAKLAPAILPLRRNPSDRVGADWSPFHVQLATRHPLVARRQSHSRASLKRLVCNLDSASRDVAARLRLAFSERHYLRLLPLL